MTMHQKTRERLDWLKSKLTILVGRERIERINQKIAYYPDRVRAHLPEWTHRFIDPIKPYLENPRYVWRVSGTVIVLLLTFIAYRALHESNEHQFKEVPSVAYDEIEAPEGGFNSEYVRSVVVHAQNVDDQLVVPGRIAFDENDIRKIAARVAGRVEQIFVHEGFPAQKGQPIAAIYSPDFLAAEQEYLLSLHAVGAVAAIKDPGVLSDARDLADAARNKLQVLGMDQGEIDKLRRANTPLPLLTLKSPIDGVILDHVFKAGSYANMGDDIATIAGLSRLWFKGNVYEQDIQKVKLGQPLVLKSDAYPGEEFKSTVDFIGPSLDPETHTLIVRATLNNPNNTLKPDVYVSGVITTGTEHHVVIPKDALIKEGNNAYVIQVVAGTHYKLRSVSVAPILNDDDTFSVLRGLQDGDEIVSVGSVLVYESIKRKIR